MRPDPSTPAPAAADTLRSARSARWLLRELPGLVAQGVLSEASAEALRRHYGRPPSADAVPRWTLAVLGVAGAVLVGAGITLLLAHNWEEIPRLGRAALALLLLLATQSLAGWARFRRSGSLAWREGTAALLALAIGASISLVSQAYQIPGELESFLLIWIVLGLPVFYLLDSRVAAALYPVGLASWFAASTSAGGLRLPWVDPGEGVADLLLLLALGAAGAPYLLRQIRERGGELRTAFLVLVTTCTLPVIALVCLIQWADLGATVLLTFASLFAALFAAGRASVRAGAGTWSAPLAAVGGLGTAVTLFVLSFRVPWESAWEKGAGPAASEGVSEALVLIPALALGGLALWGAARLLRAGALPEALLAGFPLVAGAGALLAFGDQGQTAATLLVNLYGLGLALVLLVSSLREGRLVPANAALLFLSVLVAARFFDAEFSFVARGLAFIVLGLSFLGLNLILVKRRKEVEP